MLVKWYDVTKWMLERVEAFPKNQRFVFGQRLADRTLGILELLVEAAYSPRTAHKAGAHKAGQVRLSQLRAISFLWASDPIVNVAAGPGDFVH